MFIDMAGKQPITVQPNATLTPERMTNLGLREFAGKEKWFKVCHINVIFACVNQASVESKVYIGSEHLSNKVHDDTCLTMYISSLSSNDSQLRYDSIKTSCAWHSGAAVLHCTRTCTISNRNKWIKISTAFCEFVSQLHCPHILISDAFLKRLTLFQLSRSTYE